MTFSIRERCREIKDACLPGATSQLVSMAADASAHAHVAYVHESEYYAQLAAKQFRKIAERATEKAEAIEKAMRASTQEDAA